MTNVKLGQFDTALALEAGFTRPRIGLNRFGRGFPVGNYATKDGWLGVTVVTVAAAPTVSEATDEVEPAFARSPL